jgi:uncharacterized protein
MIKPGGAAPIPHLRFASRAGDHLFVAAFSRLFDLPPGARFDPEAPEGRAVLEAAALAGPGEDDLQAIPTVEPQSISLNVSASCNLACSYCYAGQGAFGGQQAAGMDWGTAQAAIDGLLAAARPDRPITVGFLGGEPFLNRPLVHRAVAYAAKRAASEALDVRFSVTTNGTLLTDGDRQLLRNHPFAVTVSLDGDAATHDRHRPARGGRGSWARTVRAIEPLLAESGQARVAARATVSRDNMDLTGLFGALVDAGFEEIGFTPLRAGKGMQASLRPQDWTSYLAALTALAQAELVRAKAGRPIRLTNLAIALKQIHRGAASPYPCGAGGGYFSVGADGHWYACHRAVGDPMYRLGDNGGLDAVAQADFLASRHVDTQTDCRTCWARYLCSGGCHHERATRTPESCDFVRGWLKYCLIAYCESGLGPDPASEPNHA